VSLPEETTTKKARSGKFRVPAAAILPLIFILLGIIFQGMLRDGVATWMPTYLSEIHQMETEQSILSAVFPAIFSIACFSIVGELYKRFFKNEVLCGAVVFGVAVLAAIVLFVLHGQSRIVAIVCMTLITGCMHGVNLMLITHVPKRFKKHGNISTFAGVFNACTYVGEAIFIYGLAILAERFDWRFAIGTCLVIALVGTVCCIIAARPWKKFYEQ
jgi:OPA family glycerol-3-phosphate transporter-like MFS transporter